MNQDDERKDIPFSSDTEEVDIKQVHGEREKSGRFRRFVIFSRALWHAAISWRPQVKVDFGRIKTITSRPDFPRIAIYAAIGLWSLGTIIAGLKYVRESEVGVKVANVTGRIKVYEAVYIYIWIITKIFLNNI